MLFLHFKYSFRHTSSFVLFLIIIQLFSANSYSAIIVNHANIIGCNWVPEHYIAKLCDVYVGKIFKTKNDLAKQIKICDALLRETGYFSSIDIYNEITSDSLVDLTIMVSESVNKFRTESEIDGTRVSANFTPHFIYKPSVLYGQGNVRIQLDIKKEFYQPFFSVAYRWASIDSLIQISPFRYLAVNLGISTNKEKRFNVSFSAEDFIPLAYKKQSNEVKYASQKLLCIKSAFGINDKYAWALGLLKIKGNLSASADALKLKWWSVLGECLVSNNIYTVGILETKLYVNHCSISAPYFAKIDLRNEYLLRASQKAGVLNNDAFVSHTDLVFPRIVEFPTAMSRFVFGAVVFGDIGYAAPSMEEVINKLPKANSDIGTGIRFSIMEPINLSLETNYAIGLNKGSTNRISISFNYRY